MKIWLKYLKELFSEPYVDACNGIKNGFPGFCCGFLGFVDVDVGFHVL